MGPLARLVGSGIGLASEAKAYRSKSKSPQPLAQDGTNAYAGENDDLNEEEEEEDDYLDGEEAQWELDDLQDEGSATEKYDEKDTETHNIDKIMKAFFDRHPPPLHLKATGDLPLPVLLPQKRPQAKARGFIQAYAPVLEDCDVDQQAWFEFLDGFTRSIQVETLPPFSKLSTQRI